MTLKSNEIQPGWSVIDANGDDVGKVVEVDANAIKVKKDGMFGGELVVSTGNVADVEPGHVELSVAKADLHSPQ